MSASNHLNHNLFMLAKDLMNLSTSDSRYGMSMSMNKDMANQKLDESMRGSEHGTHGEDAEEGETTLYNSIKEHGIVSPVHIMKEESGEHFLLQGHHRVVVAHSLNPLTPVPVKYVKGTEKESWED